MGGAFDINSIMMYQYPPGLAVYSDGTPFVSPINTVLTAHKGVAAMAYPVDGVPKSNEETLVVGDPAQPGKIDVVGRVLRYRSCSSPGDLHRRDHGDIGAGRPARQAGRPRRPDAGRRRIEPQASFPAHEYRPGLFHRGPARAADERDRRLPDRREPDAGGLRRSNSASRAEPFARAPAGGPGRDSTPRRAEVPRRWLQPSTVSRHPLPAFAPGMPPARKAVGRRPATSKRRELT